MKLNRAILGSDSNKLYCQFWPLAASAWSQFGILPTLGFVGNVDLDRSLGCIIHLEKQNDIPSSFSAQVSRCFIPALFPEEASIISDIDMLPLNKDYFVGNALNVPDDHLIIYSADTLPEIKTFPMCYIAAKGYVFQEILNLKADASIDDIQQKIREWYSDDTGWFTDEIRLTQAILDWKGYPDKCVLLSRGGWNPYAYRRIDRAQWEINRQDLLQNMYIDAHLLRPLTKYIYDINPLIQYLNINPRLLTEVQPSHWVASYLRYHFVNNKFSRLFSNSHRIRKVKQVARSIVRQILG